MKIAATATTTRHIWLAWLRFGLMIGATAGMVAGAAVAEMLGFGGVILVGIGAVALVVWTVSYAISNIDLEAIN